MGAIGDSRVESHLDKALKSAYEQLGKIFYEQNTSGEVDEEYRELFDKIAKVLQEKNLLVVRMLARQGKRKCDACTKIVPVESLFCNMCGTKLEPLAEEVLQPSKPTVKSCIKCGTRIEDGAAFCTNCGTRCEDSIEPV